jgi:hypothetical protein
MKLSLLCLMLLFTVPEVSVATPLTFDEFGTSPSIDVNGLHTQGVLFGFTPGQAMYNWMIGTSGNAVLTSDPVLMGPTTGTLTLAFDVPTPLLQFDIVLLSIFPIGDSSGPAYTVLLSTGTTLTGNTAPQPGGVYSEGQFQYNGQPISGATITFFNSVDAGGGTVDQFGIDNLTFSPEPGTNILIAAGLIAVGLLKRSFRSRP